MFSNWKGELGRLKLAFNIAYITLIIIGLDFQVIIKDKEVFRVCWGLQWLFKEILPKYKNK